MRKLKEEVARAQERESHITEPDWDGTPAETTPINDNTPRKSSPTGEGEGVGEGEGEGEESRVSREKEWIQKLESVSEGKFSEENLHGLGEGPGLEGGLGEEKNKMGNGLSAKRPSTRMTDDLVDSDLMDNDNEYHNEMRQASSRGRSSNNSRNGNNNNNHNHNNDGNDDDASIDSSSRYYNQMLVAEIQRLKKELRDVNDDVEQLTLEKFKIATEKDCTPAAMLFFSTLHDPNMVPTIQQLVLQLNSLKGVADCSTHMDFATLRKRLLVCTAATQILDNFVVRYNR